MPANRIKKVTGKKLLTENDNTLQNACKLRRPSQILLQSATISSLRIIFELRFFGGVDSVVIGIKIAW